MFTNQDATLADTNGDLSTAEFAELALAQIYVLPEAILTTDAVTLGADVRNDGTAETGAFQVRFALDSGDSHEIAYPNLGPGESHWEEWQHAPLTAGDHTFSVLLDVFNQVMEGSKYDNSDSLSFHVTEAEPLVLQPDVILAAARHLDETPALGSDDEMLALSSDDESKSKKRKKVKEIDFSDEPEIIEVEVTKIPAGMTSVEQINDLLQDLKHWITAYWDNYRDGLQNFETRMSFSSDQEAEAKYLQAVFKAVGAKALDIALDKLGSEMGGPWGKIIGVCKAAVEAWAAEKERAEAAGGEVKIADYIESIRNSVGVQQKLMLKAIEAEQGALLEDFRQIAERDGTKGKVSPEGTVVGEAALFLRQLKARVEAFAGAIPGAPYFQAEFTETFANTPGWTDLISHGARLAGMLYFSMSLYKDGDDWKLKDSGDTWKLVTKAPKPDRLATSLERALIAEGKKPYQSDLPKMVQMHIEEEVSFTNNYLDGYIHFTNSPDAYEVRTNYGERLFKEAWAIPAIRKLALEVTQIVGSND